MPTNLVNSHRQSDGGWRDIGRCQLRRLLELRRKPDLPQNGQRRFVIFGDGRTGSTLLTRLLANHPLIHCDDEILHDWRTFPAHWVRDRAAAAAGTVYGFKLLTYQLTDVLCLPWARASGFLDWLQANGFLLIYLTRENRVEHALSQISARVRGFHRRTGDPRARRKIRVDRDDLFGWLEQIEMRERDNRALLDGRDFLSLEYGRDLCREPAWQGTVARVCDFLGIPPAAASADLEKVNLGTLEDIVENAADVRHYLEGTPYQRFLAPPPNRP